MKLKSLPAAASEIEVGEISGTLSNPGQEDHQLADQLPLRYFQFSQGLLLSPLHCLHGHEDFPRSLPYFLLVQVRPALAAAAVTMLAGDTAGFLNQERGVRKSYFQFHQIFSGTQIQIFEIIITVHKLSTCTGVVAAVATGPLSVTNSRTRPCLDSQQWGLLRVDTG